MTRPVIAVDPQWDIRYRARLFENFGIGRAPVLDHRKVVSIIGYTDIPLHDVPDRLL